MVDINNIHYNVIEERDIHYLDDIFLNKKGQLKVVPYDKIKDIPQQEISQFCVQKGYYCIPTTELIDFLKNEIGDKKAIEIGSGNGAICRELGIIGTDNFMQLIPIYRRQYELLNQTIVPYGVDVIHLNAVKAVKKYKPDVVIGAWCTHKYNPVDHYRGGNEIGIDENKILNMTKKYIHIGNSITHDNKPILEIPHKIYKFDWLVSRSLNRNHNVIWIWEK